MKKLLCLLLTLVLCLGILAGCGGGEEYDLAGAKTLLSETYKGQFASATNDYDLPNKVVVASITYSVTWATNTEAVKIKESAKPGYFTVDVPEFNETEIDYKLTATITDPDGESVVLELDRKLPVYDHRETVDAGALKENTAYKMYLEQNTLEQTLYALATTQDNENKFINTTPDAKQAPDFFIEIVEGGYKFYTTVDGVKNYVYAKTVPDGSKVSKYVGFSTTESTVWEYNEIGVFTTVIDGETYGFGTYSSYKTMCISEMRHFTADSIDKTQYVVRFMDKETAENKAPDAEKPIETLENAVEPVAGEKYNLAMVHGGKNNATYYLTGKMGAGNSRHYAALSTTVTDGANFYVETVEGGFNVYGIIAGEKLYVTVAKSADGEHVNITFDAAATTVFTYDAELKTMKADVDGTAYVIGTAAGNTYETVGPVVAANRNYYVQFVASTNEDQTATPDEPAPDTDAKVELTVDSLGIPSQSYHGGTATVSGVTFEFVQIGNYGNGIQMRDKDGNTSTLWNTTAFPGAIARIELVYSSTKDVTHANADAVIFTFGNEAGAATYTTKLSTEVGQKTYTITPDAETYTFFKLEHDVQYSMYWDSIAIVLVDGTVITPDTPETPDEPDTPETPDEPDQPTAPTYNAVTELHNGDVVIIGAPAYNMALSTVKVATYYNKGVSYADGFGNITDDELFVVTVNEDGSYTFTSKTGKVIAMAASNSSLNESGENTAWTLTAKDGATGVFYVCNVARQNYLEWYASYSNWSTYKTSNLDGQFEISFYLVEAGTNTPETPETPDQPDQPETPDTPEVPVEPAGVIFEGTIANKTISDNLTYITNNSSFPNPSFYSDGGLKMNYVNMGVQTANFTAQNSVTVTITINALNENQKSDNASVDAFTVYGLDAAGNVVATATINTLATGENTVTLTGEGIVAVKVVMTDYPVLDTGKCANVSFAGIKVSA